MIGYFQEPKISEKQDHTYNNFHNWHDSRACAAGVRRQASRDVTTMPTQCILMGKLAALACQHDRKYSLVPVRVAPQEVIVSGGHPTALPPSLCRPLPTHPKQIAIDRGSVGTCPKQSWTLRLLLKCCLLARLQPF
ncbi:hypothetical protein J6590_033686 [Homalodisca vitripennis]|nr:hypothetical protein J6590_033686 [Homalodisca vitripennis]